MHALKLIQVGDAVGVTLPQDVLARLKLEMGDTVFLTDTPDGVVLMACEPGLQEQLEAGRAFMREFRRAFRELAK